LIDSVPRTSAAIGILLIVPERFQRLLLMNTALATGDMPLGKGFLEWRAWVAQNPDMDVAQFMGRACPQLSAEERATYGTPFPDFRYKAGPLCRFPQMVPDRPDAEGAENLAPDPPWWRTEWNG